jgi:4-oxalomesaconate hydratase
MSRSAGASRRSRGERLNASPTVLYIGAHDVDFLVRAGGTLARYARAGSRVVAVSLTMGERSESARLWRENPTLALDEVRAIKRAEAAQCAELLGCELRALGWEDGPITFSRERLLELARLIQEVRPDILITHWLEAEIHSDHAATARAVDTARTYAEAAGTRLETGLEAWATAAVYYSEPWFPFPDRYSFRPTVWVDITDLYDLKQRGLEIARSHGALEVSYRLCAEFRGYQARILSGDESIRYAEAFATEHAWVGKWLPFEGA